MVSKSLGQSKRFHELGQRLGSLGEFGQVLYVLLVANADDYGRQEGDAFTVKHRAFPASPRSMTEFETALAAMQEVGLVDRWFAGAGCHVLEIDRFDEHQIGLHKRTATKLPDRPTGTSGPSPESPGIPGNFREIPSQQNRTELKRTETNDLFAPGSALGHARTFGHDDLRTLWNDLTAGVLPKATILTTNRLKAVKARLVEEPKREAWEAIIRRVLASAGCRGGNDRGWKAHFDWLIKPDTRVRILEGKYDTWGSTTVKSGPMRVVQKGEDVREAAIVATVALLQRKPDADARDVWRMLLNAENPVYQQAEGVLSVAKARLASQSTPDAKPIAKKA